MPNPKEWTPTECVYSEIEYRPYLDILPEEGHVQDSRVGENTSTTTVVERNSLYTYLQYTTVI